MSATMRTIRLADVPVSVLDLPGTLAAVDEAVASRQTHYCVAINAAKVVAYHEDPALRAAIDDAHFLVADGQSIVWASWLSGERLPERIAGIDLMAALLARADARGYSVYFLGARGEILEACIAKVRERHPSLRIAGYRDGYWKPEQESEVVAGVRDARPDIVFLGFGTPAKEYFMHRHHRALGVPFVMGVGGTFDVIAGLVARAPRWLQRSGLEWAYRLAQEPRRMWKRYLVGNTRFTWLVARDLAQRFARNASS